MSADESLQPQPIDSALWTGRQPRPPREAIAVTILVTYALVDDADTGTESAKEKA